MRDSIVRRTDTGDDVVVCLPGAKIEARWKKTSCFRARVDLF